VADKLELEYFERGIGLILGQLEYLIEKVEKLDPKYMEEITGKIHQFDEVQDSEEFQKLSASISSIRHDILKDERYRNDREIFILLTEIDFLNTHLLNLLNENGGNHTIPEVEKYCQENYVLQIKMAIDLNGKEQILSSEATKILNILEKETDFKEIEEGMNIIFSLTDLDDKTYNIYEILANADILKIYSDVLTQKIK
jgi:hypothetical protein